MLDPIFKNIINDIFQVESKHIQSQDDEVMRNRDWEFIFHDFEGWIVLNVSSSISSGGYWIYPMLCPNSDIDESKQNLPNFSINPSCAAYGHVMSGDKHWLEAHNDSDKSSDIQLYFNREYYGHKKGEESYIEFNQLVTHPLDLHWSPRKNAYCRVNDSGEEVEKIKVIENEEIRMILIRRKTLDKLLYLGDWSLVRYFDFSRHRSSTHTYNFSSPEIIKNEALNSIFQFQYSGDNPIEYSEFRGGQITSPITPKKDILNWSFEDEEESEKKYATFIVQDWKNKKTLDDYSISPKNFANYFTESNLPFEVSPIYFNAGVLDKYKNDLDKYELKERSISCRGGWHLKTYDINEYNQVHTYAIYLSKLPYKEQLYWKSYNEKPKGGLSKRAIQTDFEAKFPDQTPLISQLKHILHDLLKVKVAGTEYPIWSPKGGDWETASKGLFYLKTENQNQWHDLIIALANTVTEGFQKKPLKKIAEKLGEVDNQLGTLGLIKFILSNTENSDELIKEIHTELNTLQRLRGRGKAHGNWQVPDGSLIEDAENRLIRVINALTKLKEHLEKID